MKKLIFEKFRNSVIQNSDMLRAIKGGNADEESVGGGPCGPVCTTVLDCEKGLSCVTCQLEPGKGCSK